MCVCVCVCVCVYVCVCVCEYLHNLYLLHSLCTFSRFVLLRVISFPTRVPIVNIVAQYPHCQCIVSSSFLALPAVKLEDDVAKF